MPWTYAINELNGEKLFELFTKKNCKKKKEKKKKKILGLKSNQEKR